MTDRWFLYDALLDSVPDTALVKAFTYGKHWLMLESDSGGIGLAQHFPLAQGMADSCQSRYDIVGQPLRRVAEQVKSWDFNAASIGLAALNAANNTLALVQQSPLRAALDRCHGNAFDFFLSEANGKKVAVIGHFPGLAQLQQRCELSILERQPRPGDFPDTAAEYILPHQDLVFITGTTFINKTITRLLELTPKARVCLVGPSTPMNPLLFSHGLSSLSGLVVVDAAGVAAALKDDDCEAIFSRGGQKVNMVAESCL
ncbi:MULTISPECIES: DUF364 domain-containing protein [Desulfovibrio]|uniref:Heavy-metal chelation domain-containing protein n=2 Tax=Desulfovibrio TaxID=872 RepID=A0AA94HV82_DESDE|nr:MULTISPECIES: DUF364 domain-containing protein [Desulfovibrio]ATD80914.1 hypothetical protein CNY67_05460 [Desulfovibrio sp. G11]MDY0202654.1 DUF364 domain-containing protein [Desulfovibrio desulfuricans]SFW73103.1 hypothetical protein SAMN02910291_02793 [Desulfovibrio desulfuricans]SPD36474.1 Putative heavy-metal chelation domain [Desulfovibrio sp. G11]